MGMFDDVILHESVKCPGCGKDLGVVGQTKDKEAPYLDKYGEDVLHTEGIDQFYFLCYKGSGGCGGWIQFDRKLSRTKGLDQFVMTFEAAAPPPGDSDGS